MTLTTDQRIAFKSGQKGEDRATCWLREWGFVRIKSFHRAHSHYYDKIAWKGGRKWMIEVKSGVNDPEPKVKIRNLIKMANKGSEEEDVREVGLLFVPPSEYPLFFRLDGGSQEVRREIREELGSVRG